MKLYPINDMLAHARKNRYAVGGFNVFNLEMINPILRAAEVEKSAVVLQVYSGHLQNIDGEYIAAITRIEARRLSIPIALQLDHGNSYELAMQCIGWGFSSIMIDLSRSSFEENIKDTKEVVQEAHKRGVSIEAELGGIYSGKDPVYKQKSSLTDLSRAVRFVDETGVDALAVSVGTAHGKYSFGPDIDFELLESIIKGVRVPIVVHGGSYISKNDTLRMIMLGVSKINIGTELMFSFYEGLRDTIKGNMIEDTAMYVLSEARSRVEKLIMEKIRLFNTKRKW